MFRLLLLTVALSACTAKEEPQISVPQASPEPQATALPEPIRVYNDHYHRVEAHRLKEGLARLRGDLDRIHDRHRDNNQHEHRDNRHFPGGHHNEQHDDRHYPAGHHNEHRDDRHYPAGHQDNSHHGGWYEPRDEHHDYEEPEGPAVLRSIKPHGHGHPDIARQNKIIADVYSPDYAQPTWVLDYRYLKSGGRDYTRGPGGQIIILPKGIRTNEPKEFKNYDELIEHLRLKNLAEMKKPRYFMPLGEGKQHDYE